MFMFKIIFSQFIVTLFIIVCHPIYYLEKKKHFTTSNEDADVQLKYLLFLTSKLGHVNH